MIDELAQLIRDWQPREVTFPNGATRMVSAKVIQRFAAKVEKSQTGCWLLGNPKPDGYAWFRLRPSTFNAHRFAFMMFNGPIPAGAHVDHACHTEAIKAGTCAGGATCEHRRCVRPSHLRLLSPRDNVLTSLSFVAVHAARTHCINGHELVGDNLINRSGGGRACRECKRETERRRTRREAEAAGRAVLPLPQDRTHCAQGHPFDEANTKFARGQRVCRACASASDRAFKERRRQARLAALPTTDPAA